MSFQTFSSQGSATKSRWREIRREIGGRLRTRSAENILFQGANVLSGGKESPRTAVLIAEGRVRALGRRAETEARRRKARTVDAGGCYLAPGFVDLHTHGAAGVDFVEAEEEDFARAMRHYLKHGVTSLLLSLYPAAPQKLLRTIRRLVGFMESGVGGGIAVGIHLEGPFLSPKRPGALPPRHFRPYTPNALGALLEAGQGWVKTMTVAPELPGGMRLIRALQRRGVVPAFGHSDADYAGTRRALTAGVNYVTHLFNAMNGMHHRAPGAVTALLEDSGVSVELISDGYHIDLPMLSLVHRMKDPERVILVSDSVHAAGLRPGRYEFAGHRVILRGGRVTLENGTLAGSALTLDRGVRLHVEKLGLSPAGAVMAATQNPARQIGLDDRGEVAVGQRADLILLDTKLRVVSTWVGGVPVSP